MVVQLGGSTTTYRLYTSNIGGAYDSGNGASYTPTSTGTAQINIVVYNGATCNNLIFKPMLESGTTAHDYEPYTNGASPNPSYPQNIEVVRGKNRLNNTLTDQTKQGITFKVNDDKSVLVNGTGAGSSNVNIGKVYLQAGETIYLSGCPSNGGSGKYTLSINETGQSTRLADDTGSGVSYTPTTSGEYDINLNYWYGFNIQNLTFKPMLEKNSQATSYLPYNTLEVVERGKNWFNPDVTGLFKFGCNATESNGEITITATQNGDIYVGNTRASGNSYETQRGVKIPVKPNTQYTVTSTNSSINKIFITEYNSNDISLGYIQNTTITTKANTSYITVRYGLENAVNGTTYKTKIMVAEGTDTDYEPYQTPQTYQLSLGEYELAKIGTYQDRIYKNNDKWYIEKKIEKLILNGSEAWNTARSTSPYIYAINVPNYMRTNELVCMSNYFKGVANGTYGSMTNNEIKFRYYTDNNKDMYICSSDFPTLADFKTWLGTHNTEVRYVLATPTYEEITNETLVNELNELEKMYSYSGQTNINISGNLPMILSVSALKGE